MFSVRVATLAFMLFCVCERIKHTVSFARKMNKLNKGIFADGTRSRLFGIIDKNVVEIKSIQVCTLISRAN